MRVKYRVVGGLVGCLPGNVQQNMTASIPLLLCFEELALLHSLGAFSEVYVAFSLLSSHSFRRLRRHSSTRQRIARRGPHTRNDATIQHHVCFTLRRYFLIFFVPLLSVSRASTCNRRDALLLRHRFTSLSRKRA